MKINSLKQQKHGYLIHTWSDKALKGTIANRALPSFQFEITLTVPLNNGAKQNRLLVSLRISGIHQKRFEWV